MARSIVITSGKGGVGKSTVATNIGAGLACGGRKVLLADMDIGLRSLDLMLGAQNDLVYDLTDVVQGVCPLDEAIFQDKRRSDLWLLPASQQTGSASVTPADMKALKARLLERFDYVVFDCPAGVERGFRNACAAADCAIIVITPDPISLRSAERVKDILTLDGVADISLLINRISNKPALSTDECIARMELPVTGFVPEDPSVSLYAAEGIPILDRETPAGDAYERIVRRLLGEQIKYKIPHDTLLHKIRTRFGKVPS